MNKNISKKILVGLLAFNIFTTTAFSVQGNDSKITYSQEKKIFLLLFQTKMVLLWIRILLLRF